MVSGGSSYNTKREVIGMVNIKEIARTAGVSIATVSRVLNHHPYVSAEKRNRVLEAVKQLNYTQNANAIHLVKGKTNTIGVILPFVNIPYYSTIVEGIAEEAIRFGYHLTLCQTNYDIKEELRVLNMLKQKQFDGIIICSREASWDLIEPYTNSGTIVACEEIQTQSMSSVHINHYEGFLLGMNHLLSKGHRRIGYCMARKNSYNSKNRERAYRNALTAAGEPVREQWMFHNCYSIEDGVNVVHAILNMKERPTALFAASDQVAAGIVTEAKRLGIAVPDELAVIGFDNHPIANALDITTIEQPCFEMGRHAFSLFHRHFTGQAAAHEHRELSFKLIERSTV
jgi:DNA-binding LacI/PurR family transcriptional regulator